MFRVVAMAVDSSVLLLSCSITTGAIIEIPGLLLSMLYDNNIIAHIRPSYSQRHSSLSYCLSTSTSTSASTSAMVQYRYLSACFWSLYKHFPHVVVAVKSEKDANWIRQNSTLPFHDVMLLHGLPKSASLPVATVQVSLSLTLMRVLKVFFSILVVSCFMWSGLLDSFDVLLSRLIISLA